MSVIIGLLFSLLSTGIIVSFSFPYYAKQKFFIAFNQFLQKVNVNTNFFQDNIHSLISDPNYNYDSHIFGDVIKEYQSYLNVNDKKSFLNKIDKLKMLNVNDKLQIGQFFVGLGHCDCETQTKTTNAVCEYIKERLDDANNEVRTKAILIQKLGIIAGLVVFILLL